MLPLAPTTPYRDPAPAVFRFPVGPSPDGSQIVLLRSQDAGSGFTASVANRGDRAFTFAIKQSSDAGQSDAWAAMTLRYDAGATATSLTVQPGGVAEVSVDYATSQEAYVCLFTTETDAVGSVDLSYDNGSFTRASKPVLTPDVLANNVQQLDSGFVTLNATNYTTVLEWHIYNTPTTQHSTGITGEVATQALAHLQLEKQAIPGGPWVVVKSDAGFNTADDNIFFATNNAYQTAAAATFLLDVNTEGFTGFRLSAKSALDGGQLRLTGAAA